MNNPSPLVPQGSLLDKKNKGRTRVEITIFVVLAIHGIGLLALLMQGCQKPPEVVPPADTNTPPPFVEPTNPPTPAAATNTMSTQAIPTTAVAPVSTTPASNPVPPETAIAATAPGAATEYTIVKGDTLGNLAKKNHISLKALEAANPGIDAAKLKIGQKIQIPAPAAPAASTTGAATSVPADAAATAGGEQVYTVKSGDMLGSIAKAHGVTVKALRSANSLKTDQIKVGQKLKIPAKASTAPADATTQGAGAAATTTSPSQ